MNNREIKFRAWIKPEKKMRQVGSISMDMWYITVWFQPYKFDYIELMQYTGLKDKDWKEIYEGDLIKSFKIWETETYQIERHRNGWTVVNISIEEMSEHFRYIPLDKQFFENFWYKVIWNIYENPELLGKAP